MLGIWGFGAVWLCTITVTAISVAVTGPLQSLLVVSTPEHRRHTHGEPPSGSSRPQPPTLGDVDPACRRQARRHPSRQACRAGYPTRAGRRNPHPADPADHGDAARPGREPAKRVGRASQAGRHRRSRATPARRRRQAQGIPAQRPRGSLLRGLPSAPIVWASPPWPSPPAARSPPRTPRSSAPQATTSHVNQASALGGDDRRVQHQPPRPAPGRGQPRLPPRRPRGRRHRGARRAGRDAGRGAQRRARQVRQAGRGSRPPRSRSTSGCSRSTATA